MKIHGSGARSAPPMTDRDVHIPAGYEAAGAPHPGRPGTRRACIARGTGHAFLVIQPRTMANPPCDFVIRAGRAANGSDTTDHSVLGMT